MRVSTVGALCLALCAPAMASAEDVTVALQGAVVPVGPAGTTVIHVARIQVGAERFAVVRARAPEQATRCGVAPERVAVWGRLEGRWTEMAHEVFDRCLSAPANGGRRVEAEVRARVVDVLDAGVHRAEFHVRVVDPRRPLELSTLVRYHRVGDRFTAQRVTEPLAPTPGVAPRPLSLLADGRADAALTEWSSVEPLASGDRGTVWIAQRGERLLVAGDLLSSEEPTVTVHLAEGDVGTGRMRGMDGNRGRAVRLSCGDGGVRCERAGDRWRLEGSVDLTAQVYSRRTLDTVAVLAVAEAGGHRLLSSDPGLRLAAVRLAAPIDLLRGASSAVVARCGGGFVGRASAPGASGDSAQPSELVTCGPTCRGGRCEQTLGTGDLSGRLEFANEGSCLRGTGPGAAEVDGCQEGVSTRLLGAMRVQGFDAVLGVERTWSADGAQWRQGEVWTLVTATAEWRRLPVGEAQQGGAALFSRVQMQGGHPALCRDAGGCEVLQALTLRQREEASDSVTGAVVATLREAGLLARRKSQ